MALAGVLFQAVTRNPLAEPRILGVSAGASFGVVLAIAVFGVSTLAGYVWFGIAGALFAGMLAFAVANRTREGASPVTLTLVGAALDAGLGAIVYALLSIDARTFEEYRFWVVGGLTGRDVGSAWPVRCCRSCWPGCCWPRSPPGAWTRSPSATTWHAGWATGSPWSGWPPAAGECC
ncbi:iron chelate uptake ABC transporter family permease subunit [Micromonospora sp. WMMD980]|uniref:FecCD family ABC transporter permease n=1 Tax=Micromonospora sp. WMMD980 TaxID=3016088 RepID=UPI002417AA7F|nr:iron chelate uptake ABC transporter family permease subunit [Micromonospora sp. WMMD980]MDG4801800.1 iron chelate uptake ABC transporter family permease subunit [Micromonospora sp. WMMD980]